MQDALQKQAAENETEPCMICGGHIKTAKNESSSILCSGCEQTADLPLSAYYLQQYYYRYAD